MEIVFDYSTLSTSPTKENKNALNTISLYAMLVSDDVEDLLAGKEISEYRKELIRHHVEKLAEIGDTIYSALEKEGCYGH